MKKKSILMVIVITYMIGFSSAVSAGDYYKKMDFGFNGCDVTWGELQTNVSEADMIALAIEAKALGFTYHPSLRYGYLMVGYYPFGCESDTSQSWPLYLLIRYYKKMNFGFSGCDVTWGELHSNVSETDMVALANYAKAYGFTYQPSLKYGYLMVGDYPLGCESDTSQSWPLYLLIGTELILEETRNEGFYVIPVPKN